MKSRENIGALEAAADAGAGNAMRRRAGDVELVEINLAAARFELSGKQIDKRRLAGAVRPDNRVDKIGLKFETDAVDCPQSAEMPREVAYRQRVRAPLRPREIAMDEVGPLLATGARQVLD